MRKALLLLSSAFVLLATSCKKDDKEETTQVTVQTLAGTYKMTKLTAQMNNSSEQDITNYFFPEACERDDTYTLSTNMSYKRTDAGVSCGDGDDTGTWSLPNSTTIILDGETGTIRKFDGKNLEVTATDTYNGMSATFISYYVKQ